MANRESEYRDALRVIYKYALGGNWKADRAIRRVCIYILGEIECSILKREWEAEKCA